MKQRLKQTRTQRYLPRHELLRYSERFWRYVYAGMLALWLFASTSACLWSPAYITFSLMVHDNDSRRLKRRAVTAVVAAKPRGKQHQVMPRTPRRRTAATTSGAARPPGSAAALAQPLQLLLLLQLLAMVTPTACAAQPRPVVCCSAAMAQVAAMAGPTLSAAA
jgi:hypothetical protein